MEQVPETNTCERHEGLPLIAECLNCGKKICSECRRELGYFCSGECLAESRAGVDHGAKQEFVQSAESAGRVISVIKKCFAVLAVLILLFAGWLCWKHFLRSTGKLAWQWRRTASKSMIFYLKSGSGRLIFKSGDSIVAVNPENGKEISKKSDERIAKYDNLVKAYSEGALFSREEEGYACFTDYEGNITWEKKFEGRTLHMGAGEDVFLAATQIQNTESEELYNSQTTMLGIDIRDGKELWKKDLKNTVFINEIGAGDESFVYTSYQVLDKKYVYVMKVCSLETGDGRWQTKLESSPRWGPEIINGMVLFMIKDTLNAVSVDGREKLWNLPVKKFGFLDDMKIYDEYIFICNDKSLSCIAAKEKKILWEKDLGITVSSFEYSSGRVFVSGGVYKKTDKEKEIKLPPRMDQLKDEDMLRKNLMSKKMDKYEAVLLAFDVKTGDELWRKEKVRGEIAVDSKRLVLVNDTSRQNPLSLSDMTVIYQLDPETGADILKNRNSLGLIGPYRIEDRKLIALEYERFEGGILSGFSSGTNYTGIAAFNLK